MEGGCEYTAGGQPAAEITGEDQRGFRRNRSTTCQIFYIRQILEKKWEYNGTVHPLFIDFKKGCDSVGREVLYSILNEFGILRKLVRLINPLKSKGTTVYVPAALTIITLNFLFMGSI
jgi:hypothetical protein